MCLSQRGNFERHVFVDFFYFDAVNIYLHHYMALDVSEKMFLFFSNLGEATLLSACVFFKTLISLSRLC